MNSLTGLNRGCSRSGRFLSGSTKQKVFLGPRDKASYADPAIVAFARPGLAINMNSAAISRSARSDHVQRSARLS